MMFFMEKNFEPLKKRLREINKLLDLDEQAYFGPLIEKFSGDTAGFQRIMRDLGKFGPKISTGSKFEVYREIQHLFQNAASKK
jgi:hypothetical protein